MKIITNWPLLALIGGLSCGAILNNTYEEKTFERKRQDAEDALDAKLPSILPTGWKAISRPSCVAWCRSMYGSDFQFDALTDEGKYTRLGVSCEADGDEHSCGWRHLISPCEDR